MSCEHTSRCYGACCRKFAMGGVTLAELQEDVAKLDRGEKGRFDPDEVRIIAAMVIPLHGEDEGLFTCRHLSVITGDCLNYEGRPEMCRGYPFNKTHGAIGQCTFEGCTWEEARNPPVKIRRPLRKLAAVADDCLKEMEAA